MSISKIVAASLLAATLAGGFLTSSTCVAQSTARVFELRTYTSHDGRLNDVVNRFRDHTMRIFARHDMVSVGYWIPKETPNTLIYVLAHPSREAATKNWDEFRNDPEWKTARAASEVNGPIVLKTQSVFMDPTAFSPIK
jgi:hypothetical protein